MDLVVKSVTPVSIQKNSLKRPMKQQWPAVLSTSVAIQISRGAHAAAVLAFHCEQSQQWGYKEERPSGLRQFFSFCLVRPAGGCALSSSRCSKFDSKQRLSEWARLKYYPQMHTFTWTVVGCFNALPLTSEAASVTLTPFYLFPSQCALKKESNTFSRWNPLHLVFLTKWTEGCGGVKKQMFIIPATVYHRLSEQQWGSNSLIALFMMKLCTFQTLWFLQLVVNVLQLLDFYCFPLKKSLSKHSLLFLYFHLSS